MNIPMNMNIAVNIPVNIRMNIRRISAVFLSAAFSIGLAIPGRSEPTQALRTHIEARKQVLNLGIMNWYHNQLTTITPEAAERMWSSAVDTPSDFPIPLFKGTDTFYLSATSRAGICQQTIDIRTKDKPSIVARWYQAALEARSLHPSTQYPGATPATIRLIKAESDQHCFSIVIVGEEVEGRETSVQISAVKKRLIRI